MTADSCDTCKHFFRERGQCRRYPPTLTVAYPTVGQGMLKPEIRSDWPSVFWDQLCGEFSAKESP